MKENQFSQLLIKFPFERNTLIEGQCGYVNDNRKPSHLKEYHVLFVSLGMRIFSKKKKKMFIYCAIFFFKDLLTIPMAKRTEPSTLILLSKRFSRYSYVLVSLRPWKTGRNTMDMAKPTAMTVTPMKR